MSSLAPVVDQRIRRAWQDNSALSLSWQRSLERYRIDPGQTTPPRVLSRQELQDYQAPLDEFMHTAREGMEQLSRQVRDAGYVVLLTDSRCVTVDFINNEAYDKELRHAGLYRGACWSEEVEGTCAVGVCSVERAPITVHHDEHFRTPNTTLTCSSAPVFGAQGELLAVLDASALYSPQDKRSQQLVLQLVMQTAGLIENAYFLRQHSAHTVLHLGERRELLDVQVNMLLALDDAGQIVAANSRARQCFGGDCAIAGSGLAGCALDSLLGLDMPTLIAHAQRAQTPFELRHLASARRYFARLCQPMQTRMGARPVQRSPAPVGTPANPQALHALAGTDPLMLSNVLKASRVSNKGIAVMLHGETGTGKELFAQAMHQCSARQAKPFVALNCAAIPESLIESELFGYRDGAFTGARAKGVKGKIQQADGGTLFLDEIGDMPLALQTRLLRVLAEGEVLPLGAEQPIKVDLQVICASHRDLLVWVQEGRFRQDLYFRLSGIVIELPALRDRQDKRGLMEQLLQEQARAQSKVFTPAITEEAYAFLDGYAWPGNIRELKNVLRTAVALSENNQIAPKHLPREVQMSGVMHLVPERMTSLVGADAAQCLLAPPVQAIGARSSPLLDLLRSQRWNISLVARHLGVCRSTVYRRMQREGITPPI